MVKLTEAQRTALAVLADHPRSMWIFTGHLNSQGVGNSTLRSLDAVDLVEFDNGRHYRITEAGRAALTKEGK